MPAYAVLCPVRDDGRVSTVCGLSFARITSSAVHCSPYGLWPYRNVRSVDLQVENLGVERALESDMVVGIKGVNQVLVEVSP